MWNFFDWRWYVLNGLNGFWIGIEYGVCNLVLLVSVFGWDGDGFCNDYCFLGNVDCYFVDFVDDFLYFVGEVVIRFG